MSADVKSIGNFKGLCPILVGKEHQQGGSVTIWDGMGGNVDGLETLRACALLLLVRIPTRVEDHSTRKSVYSL